MPAESIANRTRLIDLRDDVRSTAFNPLAGSGDPHSRAMLALGVLKREADSFGVQLEETLRNSLVALAFGGWTLLEIEPLLDSPEFRSYVLQDVTDNSVRLFFDRYSALSNDKQTAWRLPVLNKVTPFLATPSLRRTLGQRAALDLPAIMDNPQGGILLTSLAAHRLPSGAAIFGSLLVGAIQAAAMARADVPEARRRAIHLYIDEFENFASDRFESIVAEGRRFGVSLVLSHQNLSQLPGSLRSIVRNNVQTQFFFNTGSVDAGELSKEIACDMERAELRAELQSQKVGEAFVIRRAIDPIRVRVLACSSAASDIAAVGQARNTANTASARSASGVDAEIATRDEWIVSGCQPTFADAPKYEVRNEKPSRSRRKKTE